jgi:hypothetical protein
MVREAITTHRIDGSRRVTWVSNAEAVGRIIRRSGELPQSEGEELPYRVVPDVHAEIARLRATLELDWIEEVKACLA